MGGSRSNDARLLQRGLLLEYATLGWNVGGVAIMAVAAIRAGSIGLAGFGLDSLIEIFASVVVVWQLKGVGQDRERSAMRLIGAAFGLLAVYIAMSLVVTFVGGWHPRPSPLGLIWLAITCLTMVALALGKQVTQDDRPFMETFEITDTEVRCAREDEDILQFAMRGAVRNADYGGPYDIYLYTEEQAERLAERLTASSVGAVEIVPEPDAGIMEETLEVEEATEDGAAGTSSSRPKSRSKAPPKKVQNPKTRRWVWPKSLARTEQRKNSSAGVVKRPVGRPSKNPPSP